MEEKPLSSEEANRWSLRIPNVVFSLGPVLTVLLMMFNLIAGPVEGMSASEASDTWTLCLGGLPVALMIVSFLGFYVPRLAGWAATITMLGTALDPSVAGWVRLTGPLWLAIMLTDIALRAQQRRCARWIGSEPGEPMAFAPPRRSRWQLLGIAAMVVAVIALVVLSHFQRADALRVAASGTPTEVKVLSVDPYFGEIEVKVPGETETSVFSFDDPKLKAGDTIEVLTDPTGEIGPVRPDDLDPDGDLTMTVAGAEAAAAIAAVLWFTPTLRRRRLARLAAAPGPALRCRAVVDTITRVSTYGIEATTSSITLAPLDSDQPFVLLPVVDLLDHHSLVVDQRDHLEGVAITDELIDEVDCEPEWIPAQVWGLSADGCQPIVKLTAPDGRDLTLASYRPARDRFTYFWLQDAISSALHKPRAGILARVLSNRGVLLGALALALLGTGWMFEPETLQAGDVSWEALFVPVAVGLMFESWWRASQPLISETPWGLWVHGTFDTAILSQDIATVTRHRSSVTVALHGADGLIILQPRFKSLTDEQLDETEHLLRVVADRASTISEPPRRRPGTSLKVGVLAALASALVGALAYFGVF